MIGPARMAALVALAGTAAACTLAGDPAFAPAGTGALPGQICSTELVDFQTHVQPIFSTRCTGCHIGATFGGLSLVDGASWGHLVGVPSTLRPDLLRVRPFEPDQSLLLLRLDPPAGGTVSLMPDGGPPIPGAEIALVRRWIVEGARKNTCDPAPVHATDAASTDVGLPAETTGETR